MMDSKRVIGVFAASLAGGLCGMVIAMLAFHEIGSNSRPWITPAVVIGSTTGLVVAVLLAPAVRRWLRESKSRSTSR